MCASMRTCVLIRLFVCQTVKVCLNASSCGRMEVLGHKAQSHALLGRIIAYTQHFLVQAACPYWHAPVSQIETIGKFVLAFR